MHGRGRRHVDIHDDAQAIVGKLFGMAAEAGDDMAAAEFIGYDWPAR